MASSMFNNVALRDLLMGLAPQADVPDVKVTGVRDDSRLVEPGDAFVALTGTKQDGRKFVTQALSRGAKVIVSDALGPDRDALIHDVALQGAAFAGVPDARVALGHMLARGFGAVQRLRMLAVTGTNGKTTITYIVESILKAAGRLPGVFGTVEYRFANHAEPAPLTTPGAVLLHQWIARMADAGCTDVVLEASSHALVQERLAGCFFNVAALTNLTQDHLDYHGTMAAYFEAKARLFLDHLAPDGVGVVFVDRDDGRQMAARLQARGVKTMTVSVAEDCRAHLWVSHRRIDGHGTTATFNTANGSFEVRSKLVGDYNLANVATAVGMALADGIAVAAIVKGVEELRGVPGRLEVVANQAGVLCVVDYAHTPDALERALGVLRPFCKGRVLAVFGCGGDRDASKRPLMGAAVARLADVGILTSDNPRTEDPAKILQMVAAGMSNMKHRTAGDLGRGGYCIEPDRRQAIALAVAAAQPGDVLLIAGKGHEDYQILGTQKHHFDDREEAAAAFSTHARTQGPS